jgi:hypothetical protein
VAVFAKDQKLSRNVSPLIWIGNISSFAGIQKTKVYREYDFGQRKQRCNVIVGDRLGEVGSDCATVGGFDTHSWQSWEIPRSLDAGSVALLAGAWLWEVYCPDDFMPSMHWSNGSRLPAGPGDQILGGGALG